MLMKMLSRLSASPTVMRCTVFASYDSIVESWTNRARRARSSSDLASASAKAEAICAGVTAVDRGLARDESFRVLSVSRATILTDVPFDPDCTGSEQQPEIRGGDVFSRREQRATRQNDLELPNVAGPGVAAQHRD